MNGDTHHILNVYFHRNCFGKSFVMAFVDIPAFGCYWKWS